MSNLPTRAQIGYLFQIMCVLLLALSGLAACDMITAPPVASTADPAAATAEQSDAAAESGATPTPPAASATPAPTEIPIATVTSALSATIVAALPPPATPDPSGAPWLSGIEGVNALALTMGAGKPPLWAAYTYGLRSFEPQQNHVVAIYARDGTQWQALSRLELDTPDYIDINSVAQVQLEPEHIWLEVQSGVGAHGGCYELLRLDGRELSSAVQSCNSSPYAGELRDLNGDGRLEVLLNQTENYVFCYACGVRLVQYQVLRWDGEKLVEVQLAALPASAPEQARDLNNRAVELAQAGLWKDAQDTIDQAVELEAQDTTVAWNAALIDLLAQARAEQARNGPYPLLENIFYGDYETALEVVRSFSIEEIFGQSTLLVVGTPAEGWEPDLTEWIKQTTTPALQANPDLAAAYFLRGWAIQLSDPRNPEALADIERAAQLAPNDDLFTQSAVYLRERPAPDSAPPPAENTPAPPDGAQSPAEGE